MANVEGRATATTVLTPYKSTGRLLLPIVFWFGRHVTAPLEKLQTLSFIHYARWVMVKEFPDAAAARSCITRTWCSRATSTAADQHIDAFSEVVPSRMKGIWGTSYGFPGPIPVEPFKNYAAPTSTSPTTTNNAYPGATTTEIISAAKRSAPRSASFPSAQAGSLDAAAFKTAYEDMLTSDPTRPMSRNVSGQAYALTVLTPIVDGHAAELTAHLDALPRGRGQPARARARGRTSGAGR